jgi:hypothetical protein
LLDVLFDPEDGGDMFVRSFNRFLAEYTEDRNRHNHSCENLKSNSMFFLLPSLSAFLFLIFPAALDPGVHSASTNKYQKQKNDVSGEKSAAGA